MDYPRFYVERHVIHKPTKAGTGQALKIQLRLEPVWMDEGYYDPAANKEGGLFLDLAKQGPPNEAGYPTFLWQDQKTLIRAKLGITDISTLLASINRVRNLGMPVPTYAQNKSRPDGASVSLFHKFKNGSTVVSYTFQDESAIIRISKSKDLARSISLTLGEEVIFQRYLSLALDAYITVGKR